MKVLFNFPNRVKCYEHILPNGLTLYLVPNMKRNNVIAHYITNFGSNILEFTMDDKKHKLPTGIAHFLEHQLFNQKDGTDALANFTNYSAEANAFTSHNETAYLFSTNVNFKKNLHNLISFVNEPYFAEASVKNEKGIILQEAKKYRDIAEYVLYDKATTNVYHHHPNKELIIGRDEDVKVTTKEDLYLTHQAFYAPSNMALIIAGKFKIADALDVVETYFKTNKIKAHEVKLKKISEPASVAIPYEEIKMNIEVPKIAITYKIKKTGDVRYNRIYLLAYLFSLFGTTSDFMEENKQTNLVQRFEYDLWDTKNDYLLLILWGETKKFKAFINKTESLINSFNLNEDDYHRFIKSIKASYLEISDYNQSIVNYLQSYFIYYGKPTDELELLDTLSYNNCIQFINNTDFTNKAVTVIKK